MNVSAGGPERPDVDWRLKLGIALFVLSIVLPLVGIPSLAAMGLSNSVVASASGALLVGAEVMGIGAIAVMGKSGYAYLKSRALGFLKQHGPPDSVSRGRYTVGLIMFSVPILFAWLSVYMADWIPGFTSNPLPYAIAGDIVLLVSLFVLGGDFWDKIRALFVYDVEVHFS
jgi:hypothetical protein